MSILLSFLLALAPASAQDMVGASWSGTAYAIDSATGTSAPLGGTGFGSINSMAKSPSGVLYAMAGYGSSNSLITIDPATGAGTLVGTTSLTSVRGLAFDAAGTLYAANDSSGTGIGLDDIYTVDTSTAVATLVGSTGWYGIQGLAYAGGTLYAWETGSGSGFGEGLMTVSTSTGAATDVNPAVGGSGSEVQTICASSGGQIYGARDGLYTVDSATGVTALIGSGGWAADVRGIEFKGGGGGGPTLAKSGSCPGSMTVTASGCTPSRPVAFFYGAAGTYTKPGGTCAGTTLGISSPTLAAVRTASAVGAASVSFTAPAGICGKTVQAVDLTTCATTNTITL